MSITEKFDDFLLLFFEGVKNGAATTIGMAIGGAAVCYAIDGVATAIFPLLWL